MKTGILLVICSISAFVETYGQNFNMVILANRVQKILYKEKIDLVPDGIAILTQSNKAPGELISPGNDRVPYFQKSKILHLNEPQFISDGSTMRRKAGTGFPAFNNYVFSTSRFHKKSSEYLVRSKFALTGLVMMAGSISYFLKSLKNRNEAGLNLTCQKISFGSSNKACKKVTSLTFSIPIGK